MAMVDEDIIALSDEDHAMESIEHGNGNGNHNTTINPSQILFNNSPELLSPVLAFHSLGDSLNGSPTRKPLSDHDHQATSHPGSLPQPSMLKSSPLLESDTMETLNAQKTLVEVRVAPTPSFPPLPYASSRTGLVYDDRMRFHAEDENFNHPDDIHPEDPRRIYAIFHEIREAGLVQDSIDEDANTDSCGDKCWRIHTRHATKAEICLIHTPEHYIFVEGLQSR